MTRSEALIARLMATHSELMVHVCEKDRDRARMACVAAQEIAEEYKVAVQQNIRMDELIHDKAKLAEALR